MAELSIIGPKFLEKVRSSDYKNSLYAIAEIVDNSIDANANNIEILTLTSNNKITDIFIIDDGVGMSKEVLQKCVIFSETTQSPGSKKTGTFGMGLPNASLSQCKLFSVLSEINGVWMENKVDLDYMLSIGSLNVNPISQVEKSHIRSILSRSRVQSPKTIIHWSRIDKLDVVRADTLLRRAEKLLGRIHRYKIRDGIKLIFTNYSNNNSSPDIAKTFCEYDPLFLSDKMTWIAGKVYELAHKPNNPDKLLSQDTYFKKFIFEGDNTRVKSLFYKPQDAQDIVEIKWKGKRYRIYLTLAIAYKDIQKPGTREGGNTLVGSEMGTKVKGAANFPSGNIFWVRNGREITCGNYSLFNITQETQRWWTIELNYSTEANKDENSLDKLLGLSNSKQSIKFLPDDSKLDNTSESATESEKRQELMIRLTLALNKAIRKANNKLKSQARDWSRWYDGYKGGNGDDVPGPTSHTYKVLLDALGKGAQLSDDQIENLSTKLKTYLPTIKKQSIHDAVIRYSEIGFKNIIIYCELDERDLFQSDTFQGKALTYINIKHQFYLKIIKPLKEKNNDDILASIELLISSLSRVGESFEEKKYKIIKDYMEQLGWDLKKLLEVQEELIESES
jgi:hypothetical protein